MLPPTNKKKMNPLLMKVIIISVGIHVIAGFIAGIITIANIVIPEETQFEEPPAVVEEEPPPPVKVQIKPQQPKQQASQRLTMRPVANIAVAQVDVNLPDMDQSFTVSAGLGGIGGGQLLGGTRGSIGMGISDISVFGLKSRAERVLFVIDANKRMLEDKKGGMNSYNVIKDEIVDMVGNLSAGTLFNVAFYDYGRLKFFRPNTVPAGTEINAELAKWIAPINADYNDLRLKDPTKPKVQDIGESEVKAAMTGAQWASGNELTYLTQVFLEQSIDAVFVITGAHQGFQRIIRAPTEREKAEWQRVTSKPDYIKKLAAHNAERPEMSKRVAAELKRVNAARAKKGLPPKVIANNAAGVLGIKWKTPHPGHGPRYYIEVNHIERYFKEVVKALYEDEGSQPPSINVVLFLAGDESYSDEREKNLKRYVRFFGGKSRVIRGQDEIKSARSSKDTKN